MHAVGIMAMVNLCAVGKLIKVIRNELCSDVQHVAKSVAAARSKNSRWPLLSHKYVMIKVKSYLQRFSILLH